MSAGKKSTKINLSVVIPTINSASFIKENVARLKSFLDSLEQVEKYEIILAAQSSRDNTFGIVKKMKSKTIIPLFLKKRGKGIGLTAGFKKAKYEWVLMTDDDLPYPFDSMKKLFEKTGSHDIIIASRHIQKVKHDIPLIRRIASSIYLGLVKTFVGIPQKDIQAGMKLIRKDLFKKTGYPKEEGYVWDTEMLYLANKTDFRIIEVPVECHHKPNQLVVYDAALKMFLGLLRVWWRGSPKKFDYDSVPGDYQYRAITKGSKFQKFWHLYKIKLMRKLLKVSKKDVLLDLGCGSGNILISIGKKAGAAYGADISSGALEFVAQRIKEEGLSNIKPVMIKGKKLPFRSSFFDKIIATELIEHLENPSSLVKECFRVLKPGGILVITTPNYLSFWPILEFLSDLFKLTPKMKGEQHITKFNSWNLKKMLEKEGLKTVRSGSFYFSSPFLYLFSKRISDWAFSLEFKLGIFPGMLLYSVSKKSQDSE